VFAHVFYFHGLVRVSSWIACACLGLLIPQFADLGKGVLAWLSGKIAQYSYGIYLSHCSVFWLCFVFLHNANSVVRWSLCLILSIALPLILFHTVEEPMIKVGVKLAARALGRRPTAQENALETADSTAPVP
jgi:peptidoglycan/LPS O-acetylase OafA/YrhL